jgi:hypothetical protein
MSAVTKLTRNVGRFLAARSPQILTGMAVAGVVSTTVLAVRATPEALDLIESAKDRKASETGVTKLSAWETIKYAWQPYIPATGVGLATIGCVVTANSVSTKRVAAMASLWTITETSFREYQDKVIETIGKTKEQGVRDSIAQDQVRANPVATREIIITTKGDVLCYDQLSGRYFRSDMQSIRKAENDLNQKIINEGSASQNDFYRMIDLPILDHGEEFGWTTDQLLNLSFSSVLSEDDQPCLAIKFSAAPIRGYYHNTF